MNVIFLDFDGILNTAHESSDEDRERRNKKSIRIRKRKKD